VTEGKDSAAPTNEPTSQTDSKAPEELVIADQEIAAALDPV